VKPVSAFDLTAAARATEVGRGEGCPRAAGPGDRPRTGRRCQRFHQSRELEGHARARRAGGDPDGAIHLNAFKERGIATRSAFGDAALNLITRVTTLDVGTVPDAIIEAAAEEGA